VIETVGSTGEAGECQSDAQVALCLSQCNLSSLSLLHIWVAPLLPDIPTCYHRVDVSEVAIEF
ncbi:MAG: hypothetical protein KME10_28420, partial [Plectolyngbya sp. WJT66-NPBG17]|jgi:hypothetical protein|nr:hypothetical protein [Plectolyngbya sp. WJT66-NPBG17]